MTIRRVKVMEYCPDELASPKEQWSIRTGTLVGPRTVAIKDSEKLNLFTLPAPVEEGTVSVDVTDIDVAWIYLNEKGKKMSAAKLAQLSVIELAPYVA